MIRVFLIIILFFLSVTCRGQNGGDVCNTAFNNPIVLPFSDSGSTCNGLDDYNQGNINPNTQCTSTWYMTGKDWFYYFTAAQTGDVQITLNNMNPQPWGSITVWDDCPDMGNCMDGIANWTTTLSLIFPVTQGQSYYIMIDCYPTPDCFAYQFNADYIQLPPPQMGCVNAGFETGNFTGWYGTTGTSLVAATTAPHPLYDISSYDTLPPQHTIISGNGVDMCGGFPVVCPGGNYSVRLGDSVNPGSMGAQLVRSFIVDSVNTYYSFKYAAVIQDATHLPNEQPFFQVEFFDQDDSLISNAGFLAVGGPNIPDFFQSQNPNCFQTYYRPWTSVTVDLSLYTGQALTVKFTVVDCAYGGHFAYVYIDGSCDSSFTGSISGDDTICLPGNALLCGPEGAASYSWSPGGQTSQCIAAGAGGPYSLTYYLQGDSVNPYVCYDTVIAFPAISYTITQSGNMLTVTPPGTAYQWYINGFPVANQTQQSMNILYTGNYSVEVTDTNGCVGLVQMWVVGTTEYAANSMANIFPNPFNEFAVLELSYKPDEEFKLVIYSLTGEKILEQVIVSEKTRINKSTLPAGVYLCQVISEKEIVFNGKLVITD